MATGATGTPTTLGIPKYATSADSPNGTGFNAAMDAIDGLIGKTPGSDRIAGIAVGSVPVWNGSAWVKPSGTPDGTKFLRDDGSWQPMGSAWSAYSVAWTADSVNPVLNDGAIVGRYVQIGKTVIGYFDSTFGAGTTFGTGNWNFSLPVPAVNGAFKGIGTAVITDNSPFAIYAAIVRLNSTTAVQLATIASPTVAVDATNPITFAGGDKVGISFTYEAA